VVETERALHEFEAELTPGSGFATRGEVVFYKPENSTALEAARNSDMGRRFLQAVRFPKASVEKTPGGSRIEIRGYPHQKEAGAGLRVIAVVETDGRGGLQGQELVWDTGTR
jgi:hypothetical protein